jgi:hypothetical protein
VTDARGTKHCRTPRYFERGYVDVNMYGLLRDVGHMVERVNWSDEPVGGIMLDGNLLHLNTDCLTSETRRYLSEYIKAQNMLVVRLT